MSRALRMFPAAGKVAMFEEAPGGGDVHDITAPRNRPAADPAGWLASIYYHSDLDVLEVVSDTSATLTHAAVAGGSSEVFAFAGADATASAGNGGTLVYNAGVSDDLLVPHNLGYVPDAIGLVGNQELYPGRPIQTIGAGLGRYASLYLTPTEARVRTWASVAAVALPAITVTYRVLLFRAPRVATGNVLFAFDPATGVTRMARERFATDRAYLQVVPGGSPFGIAHGKTLDLQNGAPRFVNADGSLFEPVPATLRGTIVVRFDGNTYTGPEGPSKAYNGSFAGPSQILVQAP